MKSVKMKGKNVEDATKAAVAVLGVDRDLVEIRVINEGKAGMMGLIGGEEAEVEGIVKESGAEEAKQILQNILDKMGFLAMTEISSQKEDNIVISIKGEDMGRIIGKSGSMLKSLETLINAMIWKYMGKRFYISIDAGGYKDKREQALQRLATDVADEVIRTGESKAMPRLEPSDRRIIHIFLQEDGRVKTYSEGEGKDRKLIVAPKEG
ncbi:MAG: KH domain-containing protein [Candidatus Margulisbacteria bacterium]|nr:KH domain-containing protein [Candidatus Margulisiibacteriota bacterium]MBU1616698.1 KH domain-containing protein [Candidatus Margulisiibacteriota bacterium]